MMSISKWIGRAVGRWLVLAVLTVAGAGLRAADVEYFGVIKSGVYTQAVNVAPVPLGTNAFQFISFVIGSSNTLLTNATVRIPSGATRQLSTNAPDGLIGQLAGGTDAIWMFAEYFASESALNAAYPSSSSLFTPSRYTMNMATVNDGLQSRELSYLGGSVPPVPNIAGLSAAQQIDTRADFALSWASLAGGLIPKIVYFNVLDRSNQVFFSSPAPFQPGALDGNSTSIVIPSNTLPMGQPLVGSLTVFQPALPNTNYAVGVIGHLRATSFPLATLLPPPLELGPPAVAGGQIAFAFPALPGQIYRVQGGGSLTNWVDLLVTNSTTGVIEFTDPLPAILPQRFYRVVSP